MMRLITDLLWAAMFLLFLAGALTYAFRPHLGLDLLKRSAVLLVVLLRLVSLFWTPPVPEAL